MNERKDIPLGLTYDAHGLELTFKDSTGYWYAYTSDSYGRELTYKNSDGDWHECTRDAHGRELTFKDSKGYRREFTHDANGNELTFRDNTGDWYEFTRYANGLELTFRDSNGYCIAQIDNYRLMLSAAGKVTAGCRKFDTIKDALKHWDSPERTDDRAIYFGFALRMMKK